MNSKQLTKNFLYLFLSNVVGQLLTLWAFVRIASVFGPAGFGKFSFAQVFSLYFLYFADFGLQTLGTRVVAQTKEGLSQSVLVITVLRLALAVVCFILLVISTFVFAKLGNLQSLVIVFGLSLLPSAVLFEWVFIGAEQTEYVAMGRILRGAIFAGLVLFLVRSDGSLTDAALYYLAGISFAAALLLIVFVKMYGMSIGRIDRSLFRNTLVTAAPLASGSFMTQVNYNFGTIALGFFLTDHDVGLYSAEYKIVLFLWAFAAVAAANAAFPLMAKSYKLSTTLFTSSLGKALQIFAALAIPIGIGGSVLAPRIMDLLYSLEYQRASIVLRLSVWVSVIVFYRMVFENALVAMNNRRAYFVGYMLAGVTTVIGNILLVPILGIVAPPLVGIFSEGLLLFYFVATCKFVRFSILLKVTTKPLLAGLVMGSILVFLPLNLLPLLIIGVLVYFASLLLLRAVTLDEVTAYIRS